MRIAIISLLVTAALATSLARAGAHAKSDPIIFDPDAPSSDSPITITNYLKGSPDSVYTQLNREVFRLAKNFNELTASILEDNHELVSDTRRQLDRISKSIEHREAIDELRAAQADFDREHADGNISSRMASSGRLNRAKAAVQAIEQRAIETDSNISSDKRRIEGKTGELGDIRDSLKLSLAWRNHLVSAAREEHSLRWPIEGLTGVPGTVLPIRIEGGNVVADFDAFEQTGESLVKSSEGLDTYWTPYHPVRLVITGIDSGQMTVGHPICLDIAIEGIGASTDVEDRRPVFRVRAVHHELSYFFRRLDSTPPNLLQTLKNAGITEADILPYPESHDADGPPPPKATPPPADAGANPNAGDQPDHFASGSGFCITSDGLIITNRHVVADAAEVTVYVDGKPFAAEVLDIDKNHDLALIKIRARRPLLTLPLSPADVPPAGATCIVAGFPLLDRLGADLKITSGLASALTSDQSGADVMIDAKVNPGNSGGPVFDKFGNVAAIVTLKTLATVDEESYGFCIGAGQIRRYLATKQVDLQPGGITALMDGETIAARAKKATVCIVCKLRFPDLVP